MVLAFFGLIKEYFYKIIAGVIILLIGFALGIIAKKLLYRVLKEIELNKLMSKVGILHDIEQGISLLVSFLIYVITIVLFLEQLDIASVVFYLVAGAIFALVILTFLVGLKDVIPNFVAWIILQRRGVLEEGKRIEVREIDGVVEKLGFLETEIRTHSGDVLYVPNAIFLKSKFKLKKEN